MTISSSLSAGVAGLNANATRLAAISDNIANSGTFGYKGADAGFESMVISQAQGAGVYSAGGVRASTMRLIDQRGALVGTANALDIAISGRGMLPVAESASLTSGLEDSAMLLTSTGSFRPDFEGSLRTESGLVLLAWPANADGEIPVLARDTTAGLVPVTINSNQQAGDPTTTMSLGVNLPATQTAAGQLGDSYPLSVEYFGNLGTSETLSLSFTPTIPASGSSNQWRMVVRDSALDGALIGDYLLTFDATRANGGTLLDVTTTAGGGL